MSSVYITQLYERAKNHKNNIAYTATLPQACGKNQFKKHYTSLQYTKYPIIYPQKTQQDFLYADIITPDPF
jgi:hypothetical protein